MATCAREGKRKSDPVNCKLYDSRGTKLKSDGWSQQSIMDMCSFLSIEEKPPPFSYLLSDQEISESKQTVFGSVPLGAALGYQLTDKISNKSQFRHSRCDAPLSHSKQTKDVLNFPDIPLHAACQQTSPPLQIYQQNMMLF